MGTDLATRKSPEELAILVKQCQDGDRSAFEALFAETSPWVASLVAGIIGAEALVEETVQEIYLIVWKKIRVLDQPLAFLAWLKRIAVNRSLRCAEVERKKSLKLVPDDSLTSHAKSPHQDVAARINLLAALRKLSPKERAVLVMRELHGSSYEELSRLFSVPIGTIRSRLNSAKKKALKFLTKEETI